jgi:hypothetical protein
MSKQGMQDGQRVRLLKVGATAFFLASKTTDVEVMRILLDAGADPNIPNAEGTTPLMVASGLKLWNPGEDSGTLPGQQDEALAAVKMLVEAGVKVNALNDEGETALHGVAYGGNPLIAEYLIKKGATLVPKDVRGWTPLAIANGVNFTDFYKWQAEVADVLRSAMKAQGISTEGHDIAQTVCEDCWGTRGEILKPPALERWKRFEKEYAAGKYAWPPKQD